MKKKQNVLLMLAAAVVISIPVAHADGFAPMNMMNPGKWMGGKNNDANSRNDYGSDGRTVPGDYPNGAAYPAPGAAVPPGYGAPPPGYGAPGANTAYAPPAGYGIPPTVAAPGAAPAPAASPPGTDDRVQQRIRELEERIQRLEAQRHQPVGGPVNGASSPAPGEGTAPYIPSNMPPYQPQQFRPN